MEEFDDHIEALWQAQDYVPYIINYLIRHHYVRNQDLFFDVVDTKKATEDTSKNYMLYERKKLQMTYIRNVYKTAGTYGQKTNVIDNERFLHALKQERSKFPICESMSNIGYYVQKHTFNQLGEGALLKIIVNHYKNDINQLKRISDSRSTALGVLLTSYNIVYHD